jgi:hypothetical protein
MYLTKKELIGFICSRYGDDDYFDLTIELRPPFPDFSLMGTTFGSAEHMIRKPEKVKERETIKIDATRHL